MSESFVDAQRRRDQAIQDERDRRAREEDAYVPLSSNMTSALQELREFQLGLPPGSLDNQYRGN